MRCAIATRVVWFEPAEKALADPVLDPRSWAYWNLKLGRYPAPPMPVRNFADPH